MKFESFAVTCSGNQDVASRGNYFLNGIFNNNISQSESFDANVFFDKKALFAVADGSSSDALGEEAAFWGMNILSDFTDADFRNKYEEFFYAANGEIAGKVFENGGKNERLDMAVLYINRKKAAVYNIGDSCVYECSGDKIKKLTGKCPKKIVFETEHRDEDGNVTVEKNEKPTATFLGVPSEKYEICPYITEGIKISRNSSFLLCNSDVAKNVGEEKIAEILMDKKKKADEKVSEIVEQAISKDGKADANVALVQCKPGYGFSWSRVKIMLFTIIAAIIIFAVASSFDTLRIGWMRFVYRYVWDDRIIESIEIDPWVPDTTTQQQEEVSAPETPVEEEKKAENNVVAESAPEVNSETTETPVAEEAPAESAENTVPENANQTNSNPPVVTTKPNTVKKPSSTTKNGGNRNPGVQNVQKPPVTQNPSTTQKPVTTQKPAPVQKPQTSGEQKPLVTSPPAETQKPQNVVEQKPEVSPKPQEPTQQQPPVIQKPQEVQLPESSGQTPESGNTLLLPWDENDG